MRRQFSRDLKIKNMKFAWLGTFGQYHLDTLGTNDGSGQLCHGNMTVTLGEVLPPSLSLSLSAPGIRTK